MVDSRTKTIKITDQISLLETLRLALDHEGDNAPFDVDFSDCTWAKIRLCYSGRQFDASLTPSAMKGIIELQASLYRSAAIILRNSVDIRKLTEREKNYLELTFKVKMEVLTQKTIVKAL